MFSKLTGLFKNKANLEEIAYLEAHKIQWDAEQGYIVDGIILNNLLAERLNYLSNRRMQQFDDLAQLYSIAMIINEKIDLEIAQKRFNTMLGNTEDNLLEFKSIVSVHDKFHRTLILSGFCFLKIAKISLNSSFFPKPIKRWIAIWT